MEGHALAQQAGIEFVTDVSLYPLAVNLGAKVAHELHDSAQR